MSIFKQAKDHAIKILLGKSYVPPGLVELSDYSRHYGPITFKITDEADGTKIAVSTNYRFGSIITSAMNSEELSKNIKDAMLTSFEIPSSYAEEAKIEKVGDQQHSYARV